MSTFSVDPLDATCVRPDRVTELFFSGRGITELHPHFLRMAGLEALWLDNNQLRTLKGIVSERGASNKSLADKQKAKGLFSLRELHLDNNQLEDLSHLRSLKFISVLTLANNKLRDLEETLRWIGHLKSLRLLDLQGNIITEESRYRVRVIWRFPELEILDKHVVTQEERDEARRMFGLAKQAPVAFGQRITPDKVPARVKDPLAASKCEKMLFVRHKQLLRSQEEEEQRMREAEREELRKRREALDRAPVPKATRPALVSEQERLMRRVGEHFVDKHVRQLRERFAEEAGSAEGLLFLEQALDLLAEWGVYNIPVREMGLIRRCTPSGDGGALSLDDFWRTLLQSRYLCQSLSDWYRRQARKVHEAGGEEALQLAQRANKLMATARECTKSEEGEQQPPGASTAGSSSGVTQQQQQQAGDYLETKVWHTHIDEAEEEEELRFSPPKEGWTLDADRYRQFMRSQKKPELRKLTVVLSPAVSKREGHK